VDDNRHNWSDVIAGGTVGILSAGAGFFHQNFYPGNKNRGAIIIMPIATDDGLYISASIKF
jgi:membrane-associated phospholipid phosphatase